MMEKCNWFCFTGLITGCINVNMYGSVLEEKSSFKMLGLTFTFNWIGALTLSQLLKLPPRKLQS